MKLEEKVGELLKAKKLSLSPQKVVRVRDCRSDYFRSRQFGIRLMVV